MKSKSSMQRVVKPTVFAACLVPLALLVWAALAGGLGANPVEAITHRTGEAALQLLLLTLSLTPLRKLTGLNSVIQLRRMLGLFAFFYASMHLLIYLGLDAAFDFSYMFNDVAERLYITAGFSAFVLLVPLAATSTNAMIKRLGALRWRRLHRLVYVAAMLGVLHFLWLVKADLREPLIYLFALLVLLGVRIPSVSSRLTWLRQRPRTAQTAPEAS